MGFGVTELLIILVIVALLFGTKKLSTMGHDIGKGIRGLRAGLTGDDADKTDEHAVDAQRENVIEGKAEEVETENPDKS